MEVTETASGQLTIEGGLPAWLGAFLLIPVFVALVLLLLWQPTTLTCVRGGDCTLESAGVFGSGTERFPAASLRRADVQTLLSNRGGHEPTYRVVLALDRGAMPMSAVSTSDRAAMAGEAKQINDFVAGAGGSRLVVEHDESLLLVASVGMALLALVLTYFAPRGYRTVIDGDGREVRHRVTWMGLGRERRLALDDVTGVKLRKYLHINGRQWKQATLQTSGRPLVLGYGPDDGELDGQVAQIREAL